MLVCEVVLNRALGGGTVGRKLCKNEVNYSAWILLNVLRSNTNHWNKGPWVGTAKISPAVSHLPNHQISHSSCQSPSHQSPSGSLDVEYWRETWKKTYLFGVSTRLIVPCGAFRLPVQKWLGRTWIDASSKYKWCSAEDDQEGNRKMHDLETTVSNYASNLMYAQEQ